ncbi:hypothetical protein MBUL_03433 [Methylobacterium bullatum]|uniref:Uncharacterized protein n=1 Tax=Methylobacterium bullatum TaxID=570505 RepID=A0A679JDV5_9HYPH|nr:hypothetical protein MBUL_03433 [Methylobacterium bullatum]
MPTPREAASFVVSAAGRDRFRDPMGVAGLLPHGFRQAARRFMQEAQGDTNGIEASAGGSRRPINVTVETLDPSCSRGRLVRQRLDLGDGPTVAESADLMTGRDSAN